MNDINQKLKKQIENCYKSNPLTKNLEIIEINFLPNFDNYKNDNSYRNFEVKFPDGQVLVSTAHFNEKGEISKIELPIPGINTVNSDYALKYGYPEYSSDGKSWKLIVPPLKHMEEKKLV